MALTGSAVKGLGLYCFAKDAYDAWALQCEEEDFLPFQAFEVDRPPQQKNLAALVHKKKAKNVSQGSTRIRLFRENMSLPEAKTWLHCRPCKSLRTLINAPQFTTWMKHYCQVPLFQTGTKCNRTQCAAIIDIYGDHLLHCERGTHRIRRHDAQVRLLQADLNKAARHPVLKPRPFRRQKERPDISALGSHGGSDKFDITIASHSLQREFEMDWIPR